MTQMQMLGSPDLLSLLEPRGLYGTDGKHPDGVTMIPGYHGCGCSCTQSPESRLLMEPRYHRHRG